MTTTKSAATGGRGPAPVEPTRWSLGLVGFYLSCAGVALGATFAASGYLFFGSVGWLVFGSVLSLVCCVTCFLSLQAARKPPAPR
ncbi:MAG: hypothetical protein KF830_04720 [Planctomycetes bacterium]|nr:hypothetical protein [Planctomycetota bacterium]